MADTAAFVHFVGSGNKKAVDGSFWFVFFFLLLRGLYFVGNKSGVWYSRGGAGV